jgi:D-alanyl-lipoteichoic acid acyltransferase DltB (MBOAT superfamily)
MERCNEQSKRKKYLLFSLISNLGLLFTFKYFNFFNESLRSLFENFQIPYDIPYINVLLPVGISFYTFQTLSYTIDVYRGNRKAEKHLGIYAVYVSFFPQLVAGPIERSTRLIPQFFEKHEFNYNDVTNGLKLMLWGFFKKVVIADRVAVAVNTVYNDPTNYHGYALILATLLFSIQIYCDFSGYSDIALGSAQVMGYKLMKNFNRPYFSRTIFEFWRRWHISLSTWFRDYLYIPLGGNRVTRQRWYFNLYATFLVSGLWHGANWTFLIWGGLHGFYLIFSILTKEARQRLSIAVGLTQHPLLLKYIQVLCTFFLVNLAWIFFRANSLSDALYIVSNLFVGQDGSILHFWDPTLIRSELRALGLSAQQLTIAFISISILAVVQILQRKGSMRELLSRKPLWVRWFVYYGLTSTVIYLGFFNTTQAFIYFQF